MKFFDLVFTESPRKILLKTVLGKKLFLSSTYFKFLLHLFFSSFFLFLPSLLSFVLYFFTYLFVYLLISFYFRWRGWFYSISHLPWQCRLGSMKKKNKLALIKQFGEWVHLSIVLNFNIKLFIYRKQKFLGMEYNFSSSTIFLIFFFDA